MYYFFIIDKMALRAGRNGFADRICPVAGSLENPDLDGGIRRIVKAHKEIFPGYHCFRSLHIYYITVVFCSYEHGAE